MTARTTVSPASPVLMRGETYRATKIYWHGTHAEVAVPAATVPVERFRYGPGELVPLQPGSKSLASGKYILEALGLEG